MARLLRAGILIACFLYAGRAFPAGGSCPSDANYPGPSPFTFNATLSSLGITSCYFISTSGSDSNTGTSEASPWAHMPGMTGCTATCAASTPSGTSAAGTGFIFRGGETWPDTTLPIIWKGYGTATNPMYIGVDQSWYAGASWSRPIFTCTNGCLSLKGNQYVIIDNLEATGTVATSTSQPNVFVLCGRSTGAYITVENIYVHGWHTSGTGFTGAPGTQAFGTGCGQSMAGTILRYNVVDGTDSSQDMMFATVLGASQAYGNYMHLVYTGLDGCGDNWHDNVVDTMVPGIVGGHQDAMYHKGECTAPTYVLLYNNVVRNSIAPGMGGAVKFWIQGNQNSTFPPGTIAGYWFNNVVYNNVPGNMIDGPGSHTVANYGTWYFFNNTVSCGTDSDMGGCGVGSTNGNTINLYLSNNHWIQTTTASPMHCTNLPPGASCSETNDVIQTLAQANAQGYTDTSAYAFQPTSASGATVTAAANAAIAATRQSLCTTIGAVDAAAGVACQSDTTFACAYDTTSHTVHCPARVTIARTGAPNAGAYQFSSTEASIPNPPVGLTVSVQ